MQNNSTSIPVKRESNLDLLRIVSMLLIIFLHSIDHSGVLEAAEVAALPGYAYVRFMYALTQVCVNCYVLISGYFLVNSKFRLQKLAVLWLEVVFYSLVIKAIFMAAGYTPFSLISLISCFFPILTGRYWFITIYFGLYLVSPFLNLAIHAMNQKQHTALNLLLFALFSVWISLWPSMAGMNAGGGYGLAWFVVLYFAAAWFRLYYHPTGKLALKIACFIVIPVLVALVSVLGKCTDIGIIQRVSGNWYRYDAVPSYLATLCLFTAFLNIKIRSNYLCHAITLIAPSTFGVYLIHAHANFSPWSWEMLNLPQHLHSALFPLIQIGAVVAIFVFCVLIDLVRKNTVGKLEQCHLVTNFCTKISALGTRIISLMIGN